MKHVYLREIDPAANDSLARIVQSIPPASRVLDVGTGSGALGRYLKNMRCHVDGITYSDEEAALARYDYARLEVIDLERTPPSALFSDQRYDVIVCADILEHLRNPAEILRDLRSLLSHNGCLLLSIPNATYQGVIFELMAGRFVRTREGILDTTHVNFYDRRGLTRMVEAAGFNIQTVSDVCKGLECSEFSALDIQALPKIIRQYVESLPDADTYQFVWTLIPSECPIIATPNAPPSRPAVSIPAKFSAQIFWDLGHGFDETNSSHAWGSLAEGPQTINFRLSLPSSPLRLRFDFSDRPGVFEFFSLQLIDSVGATLFNWQGDWTPLLTLNDCAITSGTGAHGGRLLRATGDDPWVSFPADKYWSAAVRAEVVMTAPQRYDDAAFAWTEQRYRLAIQGLQAQLLSKDSTLNSVIHENISLRNTLEGVTLARDQLSDIVTQMRTSTSWRMTAGLRRIAAWLGRDK